MAPGGGVRDARQLDRAFRDESSAVRRPVIRCRRPESGEQVGVPNTVVESADGVVTVFVGDVLDVVDVEVLAPRLRSARRVELVGEHGVCQPVKAALRVWWTEAARTARAASRPPVAAKSPVERCGRPRRDGGPCRRWAGAGTDSPGSGPCVQHGGVTVVKDAEARRTAKQVRTVAEMAVKARERPLTPREQLEAAEALRDVLASRASRRPRHDLQPGRGAS